MILTADEIRQACQALTPGTDLTPRTDLGTGDDGKWFAVATTVNKILAEHGTIAGSELYYLSHVEPVLGLRSTISRAFLRMVESSENFREDPGAPRRLWNGLASRLEQAFIQRIHQISSKNTKNGASIMSKASGPLTGSEMVLVSFWGTGGASHDVLARIESAEDFPADQVKAALANLGSSQRDVDGGISSFDAAASVLNRSLAETGAISAGQAYYALCVYAEYVTAEEGDGVLASDVAHRKAHPEVAAHEYQENGYILDAATWETIARTLTRIGGARLAASQVPDMDVPGRAPAAVSSYAPI